MIRRERAKLTDLSLEREILSKGHKFIAGVDEAGRGSLFGPVVAAAVVFPSCWFTESSPPWISQIKDSKLLSPSRRERLAQLILGEAPGVGIGMASPKEIDENNIYQASLLAMQRAVANLTLSPDIILVDGFTLKEVNYLHMRVPQGDRRCACIAAASIVAKVFRDDMMKSFDEIFSGYSLKKNKGYGTKEHYEALKKYGPSPFHRFSFNLRGKSEE